MMSNFKDFEDMKALCRVCLRKNKVLILLNNNLYGNDSAKGPLISDVLTKITFSEILNHPKVICPECLKLVKQAYHLILRFEQSQQILQNYEKSIIVSYKYEMNIEVYETEGDDYGTTYNLQAYDSKVDLIYDKLDEGSDICETNIEEACNKPTNEKLLYDDSEEIREDCNVHNSVENTANSTNNLKINLEPNQDITNDIHENKSPLLIANKSHGLLGEVLSKGKISTETNKSKLIKCSICEKFFTKAKIASHHRYCKNLNIRSLTCKDCNKVFKKIKDLNYHQKLRHSSVPHVFPCKICGFVCKNSSARQIHILQMHGKGKCFTCEICGKGFFHNANLLRHKTRHKKEIQEVCNICGKSFHYVGGLYYHTRIHTNERNYSCTFCDKKFYSSQVLKRHIDSHTGERRFKCSSCEKSFRSSSERKKHERLHTGDKPYICLYCDKSLTSKYGLSLHVSAHKGQLPCDVCSRKFLNTEVLSLHMKYKHKIHSWETSTELNIKIEDFVQEKISECS